MISSGYKGTSQGPHRQFSPIPPNMCFFLRYCALFVSDRISKRRILWYSLFGLIFSSLSCSSKIADQSAEYTGDRRRFAFEGYKNQDCRFVLILLPFYGIFIRGYPIIVNIFTKVNSKLFYCIQYCRGRCAIWIIERESETYGKTMTKRRKRSQGSSVLPRLCMHVMKEAPMNCRSGI